MQPRSLVLALLLFVACKGSGDKPGGPCENGARKCQDGKTALYCAKGAWQSDTCKGPRGCYEDKGIAACDVTGNAEGDPCPQALDGFGACRADLKSRAMCKAGKYTIESCTGEGGCTMDSPGISTCDRGAAELGSPCSTEGFQSCAADKKSFFLCKGGKYAEGQKCPGKTGCSSKGGGLVGCDPNGAFAPDDRCILVQLACTEGGKARLKCEGGKFVADEECPGPLRCFGVECDTGLAKIDDTCKQEGRTACSDDKKSLVSCKPSKKKGEEDLLKWTVDKKCPKSCMPNDGNLECL